MILGETNVAVGLVMGKIIFPGKLNGMIVKTDLSCQTLSDIPFH